MGKLKLRLKFREVKSQSWWMTELGETASKTFPMWSSSTGSWTPCWHPLPPPPHLASMSLPCAISVSALLASSLPVSPADGCVHHHCVSTVCSTAAAQPVCLHEHQHWFNLEYLEQRKIQNLNTAKEFLLPGRNLGQGEGYRSQGLPAHSVVGLRLGMQGKIEASPCPQGAFSIEGVSASPESGQLTAQLGAETLDYSRCCATDCSHQAGSLHRDLSPEAWASSSVKWRGQSPFYL